MTKIVSERGFIILMSYPKLLLQFCCFLSRYRLWKHKTSRRYQLIESHQVILVTLLFNIACLSVLQKPNKSKENKNKNLMSRIDAFTFDSDLNVSLLFQKFNDLIRGMR